MISILENMLSIFMVTQLAKDTQVFIQAHCFLKGILLLQGRLTCMQRTIHKPSNNRGGAFWRTIRTITMQLQPLS